MKNVSIQIIQNLKNWKEERHPYFVNENDLDGLLMKRFKIYEDDLIKVDHVHQPTLVFQGENYIQVSIKGNAMQFNCPIGGHITMVTAMETAKKLVVGYFKWSRVYDNKLEA